MLAKWTELLPLFLVRWLAIRRCERVRVYANLNAATARPDVLILVPKEQP